MKSSYKYTLEDDEKICREIRRKNLNTWFEDMLYIKYRDSLFNYGSTKCNNTEKELDIVQDLVQEAIIISIEKIRSGQFESNHEGHVLYFMKRIFTNQLSNWRRNDKKNPANRKSELPLPDIFDDEETIPYKEFMREAFKSIDNNCKEILIAVYYKDYSMKDLENLYLYISSERNARQFKYRCLKKLRFEAEKRMNKYFKNNNNEKV